MTEKKNLVEVLCRLIAETTEENVRPIEEDEHLIDDLGIDSMGFLFLTVSIEREFSVKITAEEWRVIRTFGDLIAFIESRIH